MRLILVFILGLMFVGCSQEKKNSQGSYQLDETSFDVKSLRMVEEFSGVKLPEGSRGLKLVYDHDSCVDPEFVVKIDVPSTSQEMLARQIERFSSVDMTICGSLMERVGWWRPLDAEVLLQKKYSENYNTVQVFLCRENGRTVLYVYWGSA